MTSSRKSESPTAMDGSDRDNPVHTENEKDNGKVFALEMESFPSEKKETPCEADDMYMLGSSDERSKWVARARFVSYFSIAFTLIGGIAGVVIAITSDSVSLMGYALESFVDVWSSVLVLWRFWLNESGATKQRSFYGKEKKASLGIAFTLVLIGLIVGIQASVHLAQKEEPNRASALLGISTASLVVLSILALLKLRISNALNSPAMKKDAVTSGAVALLSFGILLSAAIFEEHPNVWYLDSAFAVIISVLLIIYGMRSLVKNKWWRKEFWDSIKD